MAYWTDTRYTRFKDLSVLRNRPRSLCLFPSPTHTYTHTQHDTLSCSAAIESRATCCWPIACNPACTRRGKTTFWRLPREPLLVEILSPITDRSIDDHVRRWWCPLNFLTEQQIERKRVTFFDGSRIVPARREFFWNIKFPSLIVLVKLLFSRLLRCNNGTSSNDINDHRDIVVSFIIFRFIYSLRDAILGKMFFVWNLFTRRIRTIESQMMQLQNRYGIIS